MKIDIKKAKETSRKFLEESGYGEYQLYSCEATETRYRISFIKEGWLPDSTNWIWMTLNKAFEVVDFKQGKNI